MIGINKISFFVFMNRNFVPSNLKVISIIKIYICDFVFIERWNFHYYEKECILAYANNVDDNFSNDLTSTPKP